MARVPPYRRFTHDDGRQWEARVNGRMVELRITSDGEVLERRRPFDVPVLAAQDLKLQAKAYYNLGNVHYRLGQQAEDLDKLEEAWKESLNQFKHAVDLDKTDQDAAFNKAFVEERLKQIELLRAMARQAKEAADNATRQRNYHGALQIMEQLMQQAQAVAKPFEEFTKKLKQIDEIVNPSPQQPQLQSQP